ncbi:MAG: molybdenum cofactor biosynthesis protein C [Ignavibacteria bacterium GWF2_33_9]|nr:MAG: molybdenum cofactor biosynthesis protein C [Ignavibacteria bacterium GWF2_33_9]
MVDISPKKITERTAEAYAEVYVSPKTMAAIHDNTIEKGDVLTVAKIAGIQAAKKTYELIPLCHNILISKIDIAFELVNEQNLIKIKSFAKTEAKTGIEMEAIVAASTAAITIYDMCKAIDKSITISNIMLISKNGGKSGDFINPKFEKINV